MDAAYLKSKHEAALTYEQYLAGGTPQQKQRWGELYEKVRLTDAQRRLLGGFVRPMKVIAVSGIWCGDCVRQGPMFQKIAEAGGGKIDLRWVDRDEHMDLQQRVRMNAGNRVPMVVFCAEDYELVGWYGDKPLARYRVQAAQQLGAHCPLPGAPVPQDELEAELSNWVDEFERVHLILRLSARLRQKHGD